MTIDQEIWKPIPGYEDYYEASSFGRIKSLPREVTRVNRGIESSYVTKERILRAHSKFNRRGQSYFIIHLKLPDQPSRTKSLSRIIASAFIPYFDPDLHVNHKDGDASNNRADNLEQLPHFQNVREAYKDLGPRGASIDPRNGKWRARMEIYGKYIWLGYHPSKEAAQSAFFKAFLAEVGQPPWEVDSDGNWVGPRGNPEIILKTNKGYHIRKNGRLKQFKEIGNGKKD